MSKILDFVNNLNKPMLRYLIKRGWYFRLLKRKLTKKKFKFRKLSSAEKKDIRLYWKQFRKHISSDWCSYFSYGSGIVDKKYIPESLYYSEIVPTLNKREMGPGLADKNIQSILFNTLQPEVIFRKSNGILLNNNHELIDLRTAYYLCQQESNVVIKIASGTYGGSGVNFWSKEDGYDVFIDHINKSENIICQEVVKQHPFFESIHPNSLNTLRIVTLLIEQKPVLLSTMLRMGKEGSKVDNYTAGGYICPVNNKGYLFESAVQKDQSVVSQHPDGFVFKGKRIPKFEKIIEDAMRMHYRIPYFRMISWDYSLTEDGTPILIEGNYPTGQLDLHQLNIGPIFGEHTDIILKEIYCK